jgi:hypothetical protein
MIDFTKHALERLAERGASREFVGAMAAQSVKVLVQNSKSQPNLHILTARDSHGLAWSIVCNEAHSIIVTVRRASKPEERLYDESYK